MKTIRAVSRNHAICRAKRVGATIDGTDFIYEEYIEARSGYDGDG